MRPIRLDMHGFAAFREPTVVDFAGVEYFALVGPTGSGKSTVIDAMTFALYGSVPRWDDRRTVGLALAPTANRGAVQLLFEVGGTRYLAARELRRSTGGRVTVKNARLERLLDPADPDGDTEVLAADSDVSKHVEELLGLPFEQFCVCVVLPQGDFAEFLHAKPAERQETLTRILGLGIYKTIAQRAGTEATSQRLRAETLGEQLAGYADATEAAVADARRRVDELSALVERVAELLPGLAAAQARVAQAEQVSERARSESEVLAGVRAPAGLVELAGRAGEAATLVADAREALAGAEREDTAARELLAAAPDPGPLQQVRRDHAESARLAAELPGLADQLARAGRAVEESRSRTVAAESALESARAELEKASAGLDGVREEAQRLEAERGLLAAVRVPAAITPLVEHRRSAATRLAGSRRAVEDAEQAELRARESVEAAVSAEVDARRRLDGVVHADQVSSLRSGLAVGDPCPVCEQQVHAVPPTAAGAGGMQAARTALREAGAELERRRKAGEAAHAAVRSARTARDEAEKADSEAARRVERAESELRATRDPLVALGAPAPDTDLSGSWAALTEWAAAAASERSARLADLDPAAAEAAHARASRAVAEATASVARCRDGELAAQRAEHDVRSASERARTRHAELAAALVDAPADSDAAAALAEREALVERARAADTGLRAARTRLTGATSSAQRVSEELRDGWRELAATRDPLVAYGVPALRRERDDADELVEAWRDLTGWAADAAAKRRQVLSEAEQGVADARDALGRLERSLVEELQAADVVPAAGRALASEAPVAAAAALERARGQAARLDERRADAARIAAERDEAQSAHQVANMLARLLRSERFPRWLVASALDTLVVDASRRLSELSGGQFELTHADGEFLVVDHADADTRRPVKTLSGGETFQASLSLALALSEQLSGLAAAGAARLDSIFLDEGFGTLDEANLELVAGTLENLASLGDRMVGVVTHVPALAERVPVRYVVSRDQRTSSVVREGMA
ncbi:MAG TPA: SMC family ATPase [Pseudonocardia sp.]|nr:SMC family ATPase [Pseudonocardia sp.]